MDSNYPARVRPGYSRDSHRAGRANQGAGHDDRQQHHYRIQQYQHQSQHHHQSSSTLTCYLCHDTRHLQRSCPLLALWRSAIETLSRDCNIDPTSLLEQIDIRILVAALASALPDGDGDILMR
ncbi:hypothetical protein N7537_009773 [Penicillium hordei]|uniref:CCHC-type domain-containing protein n=1 Tax=Penicillium hordei TaxID=40994 RepID=A0AAD6DUT6_9EURO|nr:uncharacterized protein N7537_009773 [Penicillium hordei]KAJ5592869.1 hypothetical protein N7537_009773 [Penicillium hordei]